jgi:hypothetical protein
MLRCHPEAAVDVAEGASTPFGVYSQSCASWTRCIGRTCWGSDGPTVVLADCSGCRIRRAAFGLGVLSQRAASLLRIRLGLAILPCARVVKGRRKPVPRWRHRGPGDRLLESRVLPSSKAQAKLGGKGLRRKLQGGTRWHSSMEGVLVPTKPLLLTRRRRKWDLAACRGPGRKAGPLRWLRQGTSEAMHTSSVRGRQRRRRETQRGGASADAPPGPRRVLARAGIRTSVLLACSGESLLCRSWSVAVKRGFIRGVAGGHWLKVAQHQARGRKACRAVNSEIGQSRGCSFRESVAEVGEVHLSGQNGCEATRSRERPDSLKRDASL